MSAFLRILDFNYPFKSNVEITGSSENPDFPATNIGHEFRAKVWRSSGYFLIDATNNKINFVETNLGPELTATITVGGYSTAALITEIKTQMEAASVNARTYTISQSAASGKWTITGSTFLSLLFSTGTNAATSIRDVIGMGTNDFTGATTYTGPITAIHTEERVTIDIQTAEEIDTLAIIFDPRAGIKLSESAVVTLQGNASADWTAPLYSQVLTVDNTWSVISLYLATAQELRFWSIKIVDPQNSNLYVELGTVMLGKARDIGRCPDNGFELKIIDQSKEDKNSYGNTYADIYPFTKSLNLAFNVLDYDVKKSIEECFKTVGIRTPILVMIDPTEQLFDKDDLLIYGKFDKDVSFKHVIRNYFSSGLAIKEVF